MGLTYKHCSSSKFVSVDLWPILLRWIKAGFKAWQRQTFSVIRPKHRDAVIIEGLRVWSPLAAKALTSSIQVLGSDFNSVNFSFPSPTLAAKGQKSTGCTYWDKMVLSEHFRENSIPVQCLTIYFVLGCTKSKCCDVLALKNWCNSNDLSNNVDSIAAEDFWGSHVDSRSFHLLTTSPHSSKSFRWGVGFFQSEEADNYYRLIFDRTKPRWDKKISIGGELWWPSNRECLNKVKQLLGDSFFNFFVRFKLFSWFLLQALKFMVNFRRPSSVEPIVINPNARIKRHRVRLLLRCTTNCCWHGFESLRWLGIWPAFNSCTLWMKFNAIVSLRSNLP